MKYSEIKIKDGIKLHLLETDKFKTNLISVILTTKLGKDTVTKNALIPAILRSGTAKYKSQEEINKKLEEMYGATLDCGIDKSGDNQVIKFYIESINDEFINEENENMLEKSINLLLEVVFNPYLENNSFKKEYVKQEKNNLKQIIEGRTDNKAKYALDRCIEEMYKNKNFSLYKYGSIEDLKEINEQNLYDEYISLINNCKIDILISGIIDKNINEIVKNNEFIKQLNGRNAIYNHNKLEEKESKKENMVTESKEVIQGKLVLGLDVNITDENDRFATILYNAILGGSPDSKLFQNVREKASLAYSASSSYYKLKNNIFINCGIEIPNFEKALKIIREQIDDMKNGKFTDENIENAKRVLISEIDSIDDEQDTEITYVFSQELSFHEMDLEKYKKKILNVTKEDIINIANKISINTIYFLKN